MKRVHLIISGDVQGVGFRAWARRCTRGTSISGWVKNRDDGAVEIVAEGTRSELEEFVKACRRGPEVAWVEHVQSTWSIPSGEYVGFEVLY